MNQCEKFDIYDLASIVMSRSRYELQVTESMDVLKEITTKPRRMTIFGGNAGTKSKTSDQQKTKDSDLLQKRDEFVLRGTFCRLVIRNTMSALEACHPRSDAAHEDDSTSTSNDNGNNNNNYYNNDGAIHVCLHPPSDPGLASYL